MIEIVQSNETSFPPRRSEKDELIWIILFQTVSQSFPTDTFPSLDRSFVFHEFTIFAQNITHRKWNIPRMSVCFQKPIVHLLQIHWNRRTSRLNIGVIGEKRIDWGDWLKRKPADTRYWIDLMNTTSEGEDRFRQPTDGRGLHNNGDISSSSMMTASSSSSSSAAAVIWLSFWFE